MPLYSVIIDGERLEFTASDINDAVNIVIAMNDRGQDVLISSLKLVADKQKLK